jgi:hypothetical protein
MTAMIDLHLSHKPGKAADIRNKKQAPVFHFFLLKLLITDYTAKKDYIRPGKNSSIPSQSINQRNSLLKKSPDKYRENN